MVRPFFFYFCRMRRVLIVFTVIFLLMLLLPATWEGVHCIRSGDRFQPIDLLTDVVVQPFVREKSIAHYADSLQNEWNSVRKQGVYDEETLEKTYDLLTSFKGAVLQVNSYTSLDTMSNEMRVFSRLDSTLGALGENETTLKKADSLVKILYEEYSSFSVFRIVQMYRKNGFWTSRYLRAYEHRLEEENAMVKALRPPYQTFVWNVFKNPGEKVVLGENEWLFYRQDVEFLTRPAPLDPRARALDNPLKAILDFKRQLQEKGIALLVVVVPGKPSIYPEQVEKSMAPLTGKDFSHSIQFLDTLQKSGVDCVNLFSVFAKAKKQDKQGDYLYLNRDTHWTPRGAELAAKTIAARVRRYDFATNFPVHEYVDSVVEVARTGDVATMSGLNVFGTQKVRAAVVRDTLGAPFKDDYRKAQILILGDSFSRIYQTDAPMNAGWIAHFAKEMNTTVASIVSDGGASTLVREKLARKSSILKNKKLVIWEFVERDFRFGADGWKQIEMK